MPFFFNWSYFRWSSFAISCLKFSIIVFKHSAISIFMYDRFCSTIFLYSSACRIRWCVIFSSYSSTLLNLSACSLSLYSWVFSLIPCALTVFFSYSSFLFISLILSSLFWDLIRHYSLPSQPPGFFWYILLFTNPAVIGSNVVISSMFDASSPFTLSLRFSLHVAQYPNVPLLTMTSLIATLQHQLAYVVSCIAATVRFHMFAIQGGLSFFLDQDLSSSFS